MPQYPDLQLFVAGDWKGADGAPVTAAHQPVAADS
jgi:hypothetical protein